MALAPLPAATVKLITSAQIITSVSSAVKELFENSLDAGATSVDVKLVNNGLDRIEVKDNGSGISKESTSCMALPHYTSKITEFNDLESLETYGFRGEALNALCKVGQVTVTTATSTDNMSIVYTLDPSGNISGSKPAPYVQGTTVVVSNLFKNLPVRRQLMGSSKKAQEELKVIETVVKSLAVIKANIRVTLSHNKCLIWQKTPCSSLQNSFSQLIGYSSCQQLEQISLKINDEVGVNMFIPKRGCDINSLTKTTPAFSLVFVNERPITMKKLLKILHQQLAEKFGDSFSPRKFAVCLFSVTVSPSEVDVNLEPNKTRVLLKDEDLILNGVQNELRAYYSIPNFEKESSTMQKVDCMEQLHSPPSDVDEECARKRRKLEEDPPSPIKYGIFHSSQNVSRTCSASENNEKPHLSSDNPLPSITRVDGAVRNSVEAPVIAKPLSPSSNPPPAPVLDSESPFTFHNSFQSPPTHGGLSPKAPAPAVIENNLLNFGNSLQAPSAPSEKHRNDECHLTNLNYIEKERNDSVNVSLVSLDNTLINAEADLTLPGEQNGAISNDRGVEHLWDDDSNDLNGLSSCLDALVSDSSTKAENDNAGDLWKGADVIGSEAWSMGHVGGLQDNFVKGSCVLIGNDTKPMDGEPQPPTHQQDISPKQHEECPEENVSFLDLPSKNPNHSPQKSPKLFSSQKSPSNRTSPGINSSLQSVSSQMGRRELAAFTKFARDIRPQIILENPGISFTHVASMLAEKWQSLPDEERERYEEIARETAVCKKVWKSQDGQKKLEWVKKLPNNVEKNKKVQPRNRQHRPKRREVQVNICMEDIKAKTSKSLKQGQIFAVPGTRLIGCLEPSGTWILLENSVIILLSHSRLQEVVINHRLLSTHTLSTQPSPLMEHINQEVLGEDAWKILLSLPCTFDELRQSKVVSADIVVKNGFKIEIQKDNQWATLTEVADTLNFYGPKELKEILLLAKSWPDTELSKCRPLRVASHIKSEAMRICRKSPPALARTMVQELLEYWRSAMAPGDGSCLHSRPILTPIYSLSEKTEIPPARVQNSV